MYKHKVGNKAQSKEKKASMSWVRNKQKRTLGEKCFLLQRIVLTSACCENEMAFVHLINRPLREKRVRKSVCACVREKEREREKTDAII